MDIGITLAVLCAVTVALGFLRAQPAVVLLSGLAALLVTGVVQPEQALDGFGNEGLITVAVLYVVAEGLKQTGAVTLVGQRLLGQPKSVRGAQMRVMLPAAVISALMNNTPVVLMSMPIVGDWGRKLGIAVSQLLMPLSFATILGGLCTLVGTSTTLVVNDLLKREAPESGLKMFEIAWVGVPSALLGILYLWTCGRKLLPERRSAVRQLDDPREYTVEMIVDPGSPHVGRSIEEAGLRHLTGMYLMEIDRGGHVLAAVASTERLEANDRLVFVGIVESVVELRKIPGLKPATDQMFKLDSPRSERCMMEAVVSNSYPYLGMTIRESRFRSKYNAAVIAVARNGQRVNKKIGDIELLPGDTLLLESHPDFVETQRNSRDFYLVSRVEDSSPPRHDRAPLAQMILVAMVLVVAFERLTMLKAAVLAAGLMILTRCCSVTSAKRSIDWGVLIPIAAGLGIGEGLKASGAAELLANWLIEIAGPRPHLVLAIVYGVTMVFTNLITAKAAAVLFFPIAMAAAHSLGADIMPFAIAVIIAAAASFATPHGYQTNLMIFGPGGYRFGDFLRLGVPLSLIVWATTVLIAPMIWPFWPK